MPDVWTTNPPKLKKALTELGVACGNESRVLTPRDPNWTCYLDPLPNRYDVYIHPVWQFYRSPQFYGPVLIALIFGVLLGLSWGKRFWRS